MLLKHGTLDWIEKPLRPSQHLGNGKSSNGWHNYEPSILLSLTTELLNRPRAGSIKRREQENKFRSRGFAFWAHHEIDLSPLEEFQTLVPLFSRLLGLAVACYKSRALVHWLSPWKDGAVCIL